MPQVVALPVASFTDAETFTGAATDVVIADCLDPDPDPGPKANVTTVPVDVVQVLKGERKPGKAEPATIGQPMEKGRRHLMTSFGGPVGEIKFLANGHLPAVEVPVGFDPKALEGKTAAEQTQLVFDAARTGARPVNRVGAGEGAAGGDGSEVEVSAQKRTGRRASERRPFTPRTAAGLLE